MIDRSDMLELTRRMTLTRSCFDRIAGAYMTAEGEIDDTFNVSYLNQKAADKTKYLANAKTVPFSKTNDQLTEHRFSDDGKGKGSIWQLLLGIVNCGLKNDLLLELLYEQIGIFYEPVSEYGISVIHGVYDVPMKSTDKGYLYESEIVYDFIICTVSPLLPEYELGKPDYGFLFPAFSYRCGDRDAIDVFNRNPDHPQDILTEIILGKR